MNVNSATSSDNTYTTEAYSSKGVSGLASGMDTEGLVKAMLSPTQNKIDKQESLIKIAEMRQEEYRNVITQINDFSDKYFSVTGEYSLALSSNFKAFNTTSSSYAVKATSTANSLQGSFEIEVKQLATAAKCSSSGTLSGLKDITFTFPPASDGADDSFPKELTVNNNGVTGKISISEDESIESFNEKLYDAFGAGIKLDDNGKVQVGTGFTVTFAGDALKSLTGSDETRVSNRFTMSDKLSDIFGDGGSDDEVSFTLNGKEFTFSADDTLSTMINTVNKSSAGVSMVYNSLNDKLTLQAQNVGENSVIEFHTDNQKLKALFGGNDISEKGTDAIVNIDGEDISYGDNNMTYNGVDLSLKSVSYGPVTIETEQNSEKALDTIVSFVEDYNKLIESLNKKTHEKEEYKKYAPLTKAQEKEMTDDEIDKWNKKSKTGLLGNDSDIETFLLDMRKALFGTAASGKFLSDIGIETSSDWKDYGKLTIDKDKLKEAVSKDIDTVKELFAGSGNVVDKLQNACKKAANTSSATPGRLVTIAGIAGKPSEKTSTLYKNIQSYQNQIKTLKAQYDRQKTRYWKQFNSMEEAISKMNSTSNWLSGMMMV